MSVREIEEFLANHFPQAMQFGARIAQLDEQGLVLAFDAGERHLRPGGTVSGPTLMTLADTATYLAILSRLGPVTAVVTSSLEMHFLRRPAPGELRATARLLKLGRRIAVATVDIESVDSGSLVAHAIVTYAIPD
jgi:uncharacterized protein (TIGR00369 family)